MSDNATGGLGADMRETVTLFVESKQPSSLPGIQKAIQDLLQLKRVAEEVKRAIAHIGQLPALSQLQHVAIQPTISQQSLQQTSNAVQSMITAGVSHGFDAAMPNVNTKIKQLLSVTSDYTRASLERQENKMSGFTLTGTDASGRKIHERWDYDKESKGYLMSNIRAIDDDAQKLQSTLKKNYDEEKKLQDQQINEYEKSEKRKGDKRLEELKEREAEAERYQSTLAGMAKSEAKQQSATAAEYEKSEKRKGDARKKAANEAEKAELQRQKYDRLAQHAQNEMANLESMRASKAWKNLGAVPGTEFDEKRGATLRTVTERFRGTVNGQVVGYAGTFKYLGDTLVEANSKIKPVADSINKLGASAKIAGRNFLDNTIHVTTWAASVGVLYGSLRLARAGLQSFINTQAQSARLAVVFRGAGGSAAELRDEVLALAAAYGRSATEAIDATIQWSRMGLSKASTVEAVRVSLEAANVAEMTAAEATEHLSAIMLTYQLRVSELSGVLGQLNNISNTYSVTNKDMLTGITRVAAVAKQAGLPLAELMGILGSTIGATKQSGANIGNALKSIITAMGNPAIQELLRSFKVEVTAGGGDDLKDMSQIMSELYVRYQELTDAERQLLLYRVAGKTQASRMQAMLDGYVKALYLATEAQLNLSSAEKENDVIKATLKSQLQGLVTEWERFVSLQGSNGPGQALTEITKAMKNVLSLSNMKGVNTAVSALGILLAVAAAKLAMVAIHMAKVGASSGFLANNITRVSVAFASMNKSMGAALATFYSTAEKSFKASQNPLTGIQLVYANITRDVMKLGSAIGKLKWGEHIASLGAGFRGLGGAVTLATSAVGALVRSVSLAMVALWEFAIPIALIYGGIKLWNWGMEAIGRNSDSSTKRVHSLSTEIDTANNRMQAFARTAKLFETAKSVLTMSNESGQGERAKWRKVIGDIDAAAGKEIDSANGDSGKIVETLERYKQKYLNKSTLESSIAVSALEQQIQQTKAEVERLERAPKGLRNEQNLQDQKKQLSELEGKRIAAMTEENDAAKLYEQTNLRTLSIVERQQATLRTIKEIYDSFSAASPLAKHLISTESIQAQIVAKEQYIASLNQEDKAESAILSRIGKKKERLENEVKDAQLKLATILNSKEYKKGDTGLGFNVNETGHDVIALRERIQSLQSHISMLPSHGMAGANWRSQQYTKTDQEIRQLKAELAAAQSPEVVSRQAEISRMQINNQLAQARARSLFVGANDTDQKIAGMRGMEQLYKREADLANNAKASELERSGARTRAAEVLTQIQKTYVDLVTKQWELEKDILDTKEKQRKEYEKALLLSGPGDMLKRLAAFRIAQRGGGRSIGSLMAMDPSMREMVMQVNGTTPDIMEMMEQKNRLTQEWIRRTGNRNGPSQAQLDSMIKQTAIGQALSAGQQRDSATMLGYLKPMMDAAYEAGTAIKNFNAQIITAADHLSILPDVVRTLIAAGAPQGGTGPTRNARSGQFSGVNTATNS